MVAAAGAPSLACTPGFTAVPYGVCGGDLARAQALIDDSAHPSTIINGGHGGTREVSLPYLICIFIYTQNHLLLHAFG
jgi:hypothetical protein